MTGGCTSSTAIDSKRSPPLTCNGLPRRTWGENNRTVGLFLPTKAPVRTKIPATPNLAEMIGNYKGRKTVATGEAFDVSPENIEKNTIRTTLDNGLKVAMLPKKTRGEAVQLSLTLRYGTAGSLGGKTSVGEFLPTLMSRGTKKYTRTPVGRQAGRTPGNAGRKRRSTKRPGIAGFSVRATRSSLPQVLDLLRQVLREPTLPQSELDLMKQRALASLEQQKSEPQTRAIRLLRREFRPFKTSDPRYEPTIEEEIAAIKSVERKQLVTLYENFLGGNHGELAVVGDFDPKATLPLLNSLVSGWEADESYEHIERHGDLPYKPGSHRILTPDKANAVYYAGIVFSMKDSHPDYPSLIMSNYILGGGSLASRLGDRVRQKEGLSYSIASFFRATSVDQRGSLTIGAISNPQNTPKVVKAIREEIDKLLKSGVTPAKARRRPERVPAVVAGQPHRRCPVGRHARRHPLRQADTRFRRRNWKSGCRPRPPRAS
ncbi:MAG: hypothetical protein Ct9H300mP1_26230 [Planctomycetaceae bacterium]|nr:MAG: hypothetical protein Ct9H300mP1_26230 [Planctomycetaceae bacterium]